LGSGYQDRTTLRRQLEDEDTDRTDDVAQRVEALEEMVKLGQIDNATFEKLRKEIGVGGDVSSTHLVKGLDWDLLRRAKAGEDVTKPVEKGMPEDSEATVEKAEDVDEELDRVLEEKAKEVEHAAPKEKKAKKGNMAPPPPPPAAESGRKMTRDEILRQLKASRAAAAAAPTSTQPSEPSLGSKFKKIADGKPEKKRWIEQDASGRRKEVLVITDADGKVKRKVRWLDKPRPEIDNNGLLMPEKTAKPLGMEVPAAIASKIAAEAAESEDDDIFQGAGADYDPLGDLGEDDSESESEKEEGKRVEAAEPATTAERKLDGDVDKEKAPPQPSRPRNYFSTTAVEGTGAEPIDRSNPLISDPTILAALKRAAALRQASPSAEVSGQDAEDIDPETLARRKKFLEEARRREEQDSMDIDYGFGSSRIADEEDEEGITYEGHGGTKRKRGPKKRKGDKDSAADVLRVLEGRRKDG
jgi:hypothetical protein